jgi:hypothetical protein
MKMKIKSTTMTSMIPGRATPSALIDILSPSFFEMTLSGLKTFISLTTLIELKLFVGRTREMSEITTIMKSS